MTNKIITLFFIFISVILFSCAERAETTNEGKPVIRIGMIAPLSGEYAHLGNSMKQAAELAIMNLKDAKYDYRLIVENDGLELKKDAVLAPKLINLDKVSALISLSGGSGSVISPITEKSHIIHFGIASEPNVAKGYYNFIHWTQPKEEARLLIERLKKLGMSRIALLTNNIAGAIAISKGIKDKINKTPGFELVFDENINPGEKDFRLLIPKIEKAKPEVIVMQLYSPDIEIFYRQAKEGGVKIPLTTIEGITMASRPEVFEGIWFIDGAAATNDFNELYRETFNEYAKAVAANAYDIINLLVYAYENTPPRAGDIKPTNEDVVSTLHTIKDFDSAFGKVSIDADGIVQSEASLKIVKDGNIVVLDE